MLHHEAHESAANEPPVTGGVIRNGGGGVAEVKRFKALRGEPEEKGQNQKKIISLHTKLQKVTDFCTKVRTIEA